MINFDEDLQKQRRNLMLISVALILFDFADVSITNVGILGTNLVVGSPKVLMATAWLFWLYFLVRYFQYWRVHNARKVSLAYDEYLILWGESYLAKTYKEQVSKRRLTIKCTDVPRFEVVVRTANTAGQMDEATIESLSLFRTLGIKLRAILHIAIVSPHFTDQIFPFVVAAIAPIATIVTNLERLKGIVA